MTAIKRVSWFITLGLGASITALVVAPQTLSAVAAIAPPSTSAMAAFYCNMAYELALWGSGLLFWIVGQRLGFVSGRVLAAGLCLFPVAAEAATLRLLGIGGSDLLGIASRLLVGVAVIAVALRSCRRRAPGTSQG